MNKIKIIIILFLTSSNLVAQDLSKNKIQITKEEQDSLAFELCQMWVQIKLSEV
jgi:hypothetical protein